MAAKSKAKSKSKVKSKAKAKAKVAAKPKPKPNKDKDVLDLESMYINPGISRGHRVMLKLGPEVKGTRKGTISFDPNTCGLNPFGDRTWCTKMAYFSSSVVSTRMRTLDPSGHGRVLHRLRSKAFEKEEVNLIEYPKARLWYLVDTQANLGTSVVPLFPAKLLEIDTGGTVIMRYGVPMREILETGDVDEMRAEAETVRAALLQLDAAPKLRTKSAPNDAQLEDIRAALAELDAALAKLDD